MTSERLTPTFVPQTIESPIADRNRIPRLREDSAHAVGAKTHYSTGHCDNGRADCGCVDCQLPEPPPRKRYKVIHWISPTDPNYLVTSRSNNALAALILGDDPLRKHRGPPPYGARAICRLVEDDGHAVASSLNGVNGEWTGDDDRPTVTVSNTTTEPPVQRGGVDAALRQLKGVAPDAAVNPADHSQAARARNGKSANSRVHSKKHNNPVERPERPHKELPLVPPPEEDVKKPAGGALPAPAAPVVELTARERKALLYTRETDEVVRKVFMTVPTELLHRSWTKAYLVAAGYFVLSFCYLTLLDVACVDAPATLAYSLGLYCCLTYVAVKVYIAQFYDLLAVPTREWVDGGRNPIFMINEVIHQDYANIMEFNAMLGNGFNAYREVLVSKEVLEYLTRQNHGKPSCFSQQQFSSKALRDFDYVDAAVIQETATYHHQNLLMRHALYRAQQGTVSGGIERM